MARSSVRLTDEQWSKIGPLLPRMPRGGKGGRPWVDHREVIDGILWVLKTGARWRDLPEGCTGPPILAGRIPSRKAHLIIRICCLPLFSLALFRATAHALDCRVTF